MLWKLLCMSKWEQWVLLRVADFTLAITLAGPVSSSDMTYGLGKPLKCGLENMVMWFHQFVVWRTKRSESPKEHGRSISHCYRGNTSSQSLVFISFIWKQTWKLALYSFVFQVCSCNLLWMCIEGFLQEKDLSHNKESDLAAFPDLSLKGNLTTGTLSYIIKIYPLSRHFNTLSFFLCFANTDIIYNW